MTSARFGFLLHSLHLRLMLLLILMTQIGLNKNLKPEEHFIMKKSLPGYGHNHFKTSLKAPRDIFDEIIRLFKQVYCYINITRDHNLDHKTFDSFYFNIAIQRWLFIISHLYSTIVNYLIITIICNSIAGVITKSSPVQTLP